MAGSTEDQSRNTREQLIQTIADIRARLVATTTREEFEVLERALCADTRKGVLTALESTRKRFADQEAEEARLNSLYVFEQELSEGRSIVGLDEVGRGPLAGPLAVGAVVLDTTTRIQGLNDSKKIPEAKREEIAEEIKRHALAWTVQYIQPDEIDAAGMTLSLRMAFTRAVAAIEAAGITPQCVLLDGNPLRFDPREVNVIKGDAKCASIAAASIIAKVERDALMVQFAEEYPQYALEKCKGYASPDHIEAIKQFGLTPIHRRSFCGSFMQESLF